MASTATATATRPVLTALRELKGRATVGDVVAATGLARDEAEQSLRELLEGRRGHLEVGEAGTLVYRFDPKLISRDAEPFWSRLKRTAWDLFTRAFKVWIVLMLVVYVIVFVALLIAAIFAGRDDDGGLGRGGRRGGHGHHHGFGNLLFWYWLWSPGWRRRPYYGHRFPYDEKSKKDRVPFVKKVFAFVFGPDEPEPTQEQKDRSLVRLVRARSGILSTAELMQHTGLERPEAEEELARLMGAYDGDVRVSDEGELLYLFPELMVSAHGRVEAREPDPAWRRLETPKALTGNDRGANLIIGGLNAFNLVAAATAPLFIFPRLGLGGTAAWVGLVWVPLVFSTMFFGIPAARMWTVVRDNARRAARNVRKVVMGFVYRASLVGDGPQPVRAPELATRVAETLKPEGDTAGKTESALHELAAEFDAEVEPDPAGTLEFRFPEIRRQFAAAATLRKELVLEGRTVGEIVYSSADSAEEAYERDQEAFDRELEAGAPGVEGVDGSRGSTAGAALPASDEGADEGVADESAEGAEPPGPEADLSRYIAAPERIAYVEDWELVAFEERMKQRRERETVGMGRR